MEACYEKIKTNIALDMVFFVLIGSFLEKHPKIAEILSLTLKIGALILTILVIILKAVLKV